jgi:hypothetical protein
VDTKIYLVSLEQIDGRSFRMTIQGTNMPKELTPPVLANLLKDLMEGIQNIIKEGAK